MIKCGYLIGKSKELWSSSLETINRFNDNTDYTQWIEEKQRKWEKDPAKSLEMTPLPEVDMDGTLVGQHLLLGMTFAGMIDFLKRIDFPFWNCSMYGVPYQHNGSYVRDEEKLGWVTKQYGPVKYFKEGDRSTQLMGNENAHSMPYGFRVGSPDPRSLTGYDLVHVIRCWLKSVDKQDFSVCEILLAQQETALYTYIKKDEDEGEPSVAVKRQLHTFISHVQRDNVGDTLKYLESGCLYNGMRDEENKRGCVPLKGDIHKLYWWLDYFVLRQCKDDFRLLAVQKVVVKTGCTIVLLDLQFEKEEEFLSYLKRSFCIFEVYCTYIAGANMVVSGASNLRQYIEQNPVNTKNAETHWKEEKKQIDNFVVENVTNGFEGLDEIITTSILDGLEHGNNLYVSLPD